MNYKKILSTLCFIAAAFFFVSIAYAQDTNMTIKFDVTYDPNLGSANFPGNFCTETGVTCNHYKKIGTGHWLFSCSVPYKLAQSKGRTTICLQSSTETRPSWFPNITIYNFKDAKYYLIPNCKVSCDANGLGNCAVYPDSQSIIKNTTFKVRFWK